DPAVLERGRSGAMPPGGTGRRLVLRRVGAVLQLQDPPRRRAQPVRRSAADAAFRVGRPWRLADVAGAARLPGVAAPESGSGLPAADEADVSAVLRKRWSVKRRAEAGCWNMTPATKFAPVGSTAKDGNGFGDGTAAA